MATSLAASGDIQQFGLAKMNSLVTVCLTPRYKQVLMH